MVDDLIQLHLERFKASGAELIMGTAQFIGERTVDVSLNDGGSRVVAAKRLFLNLGTRTSMPDVPGLAAAKPMTHIEALDLDRVPGHLVVLGGGYAGLELAQAIRRFGSRVTVIESASQLASREDSDVGSALLDLFRDEGIEVLLEARVREVSGRSGEEIRITVDNPSGTQNIQATDLLLATGRTPNKQSIGLENLGAEVDSRG
jgi:pyruvate/2-oxoglutarate dehydrogenase complex dihydrolipoamide dehydrogenase (E3) component